MSCCGCCSSHSPIHPTMLPFIFLFTLSFASISIIFLLSLYYKKRSKRWREQEKQEAQQKFTNKFAASLSETSGNNAAQSDKEQHNGSDPSRLTHSLILEMLPSGSPKWEQLFKDGVAHKNGSGMDAARVGDGEEDEEKKKKRKKRTKKKRPDTNGSGEEERERERTKEKKEELVCLYPFTTSSSATQRKIKQQYDQLVKSQESNGLTLAQVGQFVNCLVEAKKELQHRSEVIQRKFTITKALLLKADRSSFDRLRQQIYKLELEQKRLEEDAFVYNWLQEQLKLSPAYKKMLEISACMEAKAKSCKEVESIDNEVTDISFEELLAQEKKDAFWQRNGKAKSCLV